MTATPSSADEVRRPAGESGSPDAGPRQTVLAQNRRQRLYLIAMAFPFFSGVLLYGWRGTLAALGLVASAILAAGIWKRIGARGSAISMRQVFWFSALLALLLPPHFLNRFSLLHPDMENLGPWALIPAAGFLLVGLLWLLGGRGIKHFHPLLLASLVLFGLFPETLTSHVVLQRVAIATGDLADVLPVLTMPDDPWISQRNSSGEHEAWWFDFTAAQALSSYTRGRPIHADWHSIDAMLRDALPPLEDLIIGGHPGGFGTSSAIAVLVAGLFLLYRRVIPLRAPGDSVCGVALFPHSPGSGHHRCRRAAVAPIGVAQGAPDLSTVVTFANYELMASPLLFVAFFLAPMSGVCPSGSAGRLRYAFLLGIACAAVQVYISVSFGPYLALAVVNMVTPLMDPVRT